MRAEYSSHEAVRDVLDALMLSIPMNLSREEIEARVELMLGRPLTEADKGPIRNELQRNGHRYTGGNPPRMRLLFGFTKEGGLCREDVWIKAGGDPAKCKRGNYVLVAEPSPDVIFWWKKSDDTESEPEVDGPDTFGRFRTGMSDAEINARLLPLKDGDKAVSIGAVIGEFDVDGSTKRDMRNRARSFASQTLDWQSLGGGKYYHVVDPDLAPTIRAELISREVNRTASQVYRSKLRLARLSKTVNIELKISGMFEKGTEP